MKYGKYFKMKLALILVLVFGISTNVFAEISVTAGDDHANREMVRQLLVQYHVSGVTEEQLNNMSIEEMIQSLGDPYTEYFSAQEYSYFVSSIENNHVGIGIQVRQDEKGIFVSKVFTGSPAENSGVHKGDYIRAVDDIKVGGAQPFDVLGKIPGSLGTTVKISFERNGQIIDLDIQRGQFQIPVVISKKFGDTGYIQLTSFSQGADEQFTEQLKNLRTSGLKSLVIDMRRNTGGYLDTAVNIAKNFIETGTLMHTKDRNGVDEPVEIKGGSKLDIPVFVLLDEYSASASEVLAGALQDYDVAKVVGVNSYGKGSVQKPVPLSDGSALKVTTEEYFTPKMRKVNRVGIAPNLEADGQVAQMITALQESGIPHVKVEATPHELKLNGVEVEDFFKIFTKDGQTYVPARAVAALIHAKIAWNASNHAVEVTLAGKTEQFTPDTSTLILENGTSYVNLDKFNDRFPQLHWKSDGHLVTIEAAEEG